MVFDTSANIMMANRNLDSGSLKTCKVTTDARETPLEGDLKWDGTAHKLQVYNGTAWETVTST